MTEATQMDEAIYRSHVEVALRPGRTKLVVLPLGAEPVPMGMHGPIAAHYRLEEGAYEPLTSTLDYIVGATAACLTGTLGGALTARGIPTDDDRLRTEATGTVTVDRGVLLLRRIHVRYRLRVDPEADREAIERAHAAHASSCPVARSIGGSVVITTEIDVTP